MTRITVPGFRFAGVSCGIKKSKKKDLALIVSEVPALAAGVFTTNRVKAAPVLVGMKRLKGGEVQAVVVNSGNANACTGAQGVRDAEAMCRQVAVRLGIPLRGVIPCSTGLIGVSLPMKKIRRGIEEAAAVLSPGGFRDAAEAILTTDRAAKVSTTSCRLGGKRVTVAGVAKGAGMIAPHMATMLAYVFTDVSIQRRSLTAILKRSVDRSFHAITVDGDQSTNDTVLLLANGLAGNRAVMVGSREEKVLERAASKVMVDLALKMVEDGEGSTKLVQILVEGARLLAQAKKVAFSVANSKLVKTAFFGGDPNVGRIVAAIGYAGVPVNPDRIGILFDGVRVVRRGVVVSGSEGRASRVLRRSSFRVTIRLGQGRASSSVWTSDLSHAYVRFNSAYRT